MRSLHSIFFERGFFCCFPKVSSRFINCSFSKECFLHWHQNAALLLSETFVAVSSFVCLLFFTGLFSVVESCTHRIDRRRRSLWALLLFLMTFNFLIRVNYFSCAPSSSCTIRSFGRCFSHSLTRLRLNKFVSFDVILSSSPMSAMIDSVWRHT